MGTDTYSGIETVFITGRPENSYEAKFCPTSIHLFFTEETFVIGYVVVNNRSPSENRAYTPEFYDLFENTDSNTSFHCSILIAFGC